jgi:glutathione synthase/RimK-type ligase-like ATP-grasp enzyme
MKIGIHNKGSFSERWISYCRAKGISYKIVDCYRNDIVNQLADCDAFMWHYNHKSPKDSKFAKQLLFSVQAAGNKVFPDHNTMWHFDDKVGQKYLLEAVGAPMVPSYVFYSRNEALEWARKTNYPKVFKLRNGAGSDNVRLVKTEKDAIILINKAFKRGFKQYEGWYNLKERLRKFRLGKTTFWDVFKGIVRLVYTTEYARVSGREIGYIYFQDFIPGNDHDIRVIVIDDKAFAIKRMVRDNDFRASGSGIIQYEKEHFNDETIKIAFNVSEKLNAQCMAYDIIYLEGKPLIVEISYGFAVEGYDACAGFWEQNLTWHEGQFDPYGWMVDILLKEG